MSRIKVSDLEDATIEPSNENNESIVTRPKRVRPKKPFKEHAPTIVETSSEPIIESPPPPEKIDKPSSNELLHASTVEKSYWKKHANIITN